MSEHNVGVHRHIGVGAGAGVDEYSIMDGTTDIEKDQGSLVSVLYW